jgi:4-hydroxythreonine-4-phosphate dehydrogenase
MTELPLLGLTLGDPAGVGPEIIVKALGAPWVYERARPLVIGDPEAVRAAAALLGADVEVAELEEGGLAAWRPARGRIDVLAAARAEPGSVRYGELSAEAGRVGVVAVESAVRLAQRGAIDAIVTAPLNKEAIALAGYSYPGHTEILAEMTGGRAAMLLVTGALRVVHVSTHVALREAIGLLSEERVLATIRLAHAAGAALGIAQPRVAVAGLNPHAGESGRFGREDIDVIAPAVERARAEGIDARGPMPPDTVFFRASRGQFDLVVAMYHDQGHIPVKLLGFDEGVNVTIGLPIVRTSVDHGTAFDIAGHGVARPDSMLRAIEVALQLVAARSG